MRNGEGGNVGFVVVLCSDDLAGIAGTHRASGHQLSYFKFLCKCHAAIKVATSLKAARAPGTCVRLPHGLHTASLAQSQPHSHALPCGFYSYSALSFPALGHSERRRPMQLALVQARALGVAPLGLVLRDDLGRDVNKVLLLVVLDEVQALRDRREVRAAGWQGGFGALFVRGSGFC